MRGFRVRVALLVLPVLLLAVGGALGQPPGSKISPNARGDPEQKIIGIDRSVTITYDIPEGLTTPPHLRFDHPIQRGPYCGPNSLYILLRLCGRNVSYDSVLAELPLGEDGCSLHDLSVAARRLGVESEVRKVSLDDLRSIRPPYIVHLTAPANSSHETPANKDHFTIIARSDLNDQFYGVDPGNGTAVYWSRAFLARNFSGYVLIPSGQTRSWITTRQGVFFSVVFLALAVVDIALARRLWRLIRPAATPAHERGADTMNRRLFLLSGGALLSGLAYFAGRLASRSSSPLSGTSLDSLGLRAAPLPVRAYPLAPADRAPSGLAAAVRAVDPGFGGERVPVSLVYHALRVWGPDVPFGRGRVAAGRPHDRLYFRILTDNRVYQVFSRVSLNALLVRSDEGIRVVTTMDGGWGQTWGSTHVGKYIQVMADLETPASVAIVLSDTDAGELGDVIRDEALRYDYSLEPEWICCGLARYLTVPRWQNRFGTEISFDGLAEHLAGRPFGYGACLGTHVPMALATLLGANDTAEEPLISPRVRERARRRLKQYSDHLTRAQRADGSWSGGWAGSRLSTAAAESPFRGPVRSPAPGTTWSGSCCARPTFAHRTR